jgi:hypothetical protein
VTELKTKRLATVKQTAPIYPAFKISSLRWLIFNEKSNGFSHCVRRIGEKILLDLDLFENWVDAQKGDAK